MIRRSMGDINVWQIMINENKKEYFKHVDALSKSDTKQM